MFHRIEIYQQRRRAEILLFLFQDALSSTGQDTVGRVFEETLS
jgi:hypothetical protein